MDLGLFLFVVVNIFQGVICVGGGGSNSLHSSTNTNSQISSSSSSTSSGGGDWPVRNSLENYLTRLSSRLEHLVIRFDHLDSRINRISSMIQGRLDGLENSLSTTKLKMDLWQDELNRIDEQLTRKWKNVESKFELIIPSIDAKLENKLNLILRDNRRHNEHLSSLIIGLGQRFDFSNEKIIVAVNSSLSENFCNTNSSSSIKSGSGSSTPISEVNKINSVNTFSTSTSQPSTSSANNISEGFSSSTLLVQLLQDFNNKSEELLKSTSTIGLIGTKVTNMFEDLIQRTDLLQTGMKDVLSISNTTRKEINENLRSISSVTGRVPARSISTSSNGSPSSMSSSETMSSVIIEALASVESMSTALGGRVSSLSRSIEERFEIVSRTLDSFLETCHRIQDGQPQIEDRIVTVLERILDDFENNTKNSNEEFYNINEKLDFLLNTTTVCSASPYDETDFENNESITALLPNTPDPILTTTIPTTITNPQRIVTTYEDRTSEIIKNDENLTEDDKKYLWETLFPNSNVPDE